jgi:release factor glutamine methyltransferase
LKQHCWRPAAWACRGANCWPIPGEQSTKLPDEASTGLIERRAHSEPLAYLLGSVEFYGRPFAIDRRALIPRPETELLVERALRVLAEEQGSPLVVDVGTGSGCIAATLALEAPHVRVVGSDVAANALGLAAENVRRHALECRVPLVRGNLLSWLRATPRLIVANLPYVPRAALAELPVDVRCFEPLPALDGGPDGAELIVGLLDQARELGFGQLLAEIDCRHARVVKSAAASRFPARPVAILPDLSGRERFLLVGPRG